MKPFLPLMLALSVCLAPAAHAAHGVALGQDVRYPAGFKSFPYANPNAPKGGTVTLPAQGGFDTLNPFTLKGKHEAGVQMLTLDTLTESGWDEPFAMYDLLAEDIAPASDGLSVTFTLNPKARFHNGDPVLAEDVAASFKTLTQDKAAHPHYKFYWADVAGVETPSPRKVVFRFKRRNAELHMILGQLPVFSRKSYPQGLAKGAGRVPIGSGPYRLAKAESGRSSEFVRDKNYWAQNIPTRKGMYNFDTVRFKYYQDNSVRIEGVKAGAYDFMSETVARNWARAYPDDVLAKRNLVRQEWAKHNNSGLQGFVMNLRRKPFDNILVRRALIESFDFESVNSRIFHNAYRRSNSLFTGSGMAAKGKPDGLELHILNGLKTKLPSEIFTHNVPEPPVSDPKLGIRPNLIKARTLLLQAGYRYRNGILTDPQGRPLVFEYLTDNKTFERIIGKWQRDLAKIGVVLKARTVDAALYRKRINSFDFDITLNGYANSESPGNEQFDFFGCEAAKTEGSRNLAGFCHPAVETLLHRFAGFKNRAELVASARALDRIIRHQHIIVPNWHSPVYRVIHRNNLALPQTLPRYYDPTTRMLATGWWRK